MRRPAQSLLIILIGGTLLWISLFTGDYLNYVKPYFRPALIASGAILVVLGAVTLAHYARTRATRPTEHVGPDEGDDPHSGGHEHGERGPRVAWLLAAPVLA
ncbi:hypothetical protein E1264_26020, partial [Actinomadura sp. KC216]